MKNISLNNESLNLKKHHTYYIIDALYLDELKTKVSHKSELLEIREKIFPYTDTPYAVFIPANELFEIKQFKKVYYDEITEDFMSFFSTDTGLIIIVNEEILINFLEFYNYSDLVQTDFDELINSSYWKRITSKFDTKDVALVLSYLNDLNDFDGGGTFQVINNPAE